jgi:hypothetical protein
VVSTACVIVRVQRTNICSFHNPPVNLAFALQSLPVRVAYVGLFLLRLIYRNHAVLTCIRVRCVVISACYEYMFSIVIPPARLRTRTHSSHNTAQPALVCVCVITPLVRRLHRSYCASAPANATAPKSLPAKQTRGIPQRRDQNPILRGVVALLVGYHCSERCASTSLVRLCNYNIVQVSQEGNVRAMCKVMYKDTLLLLFTLVLLLLPFLVLCCAALCCALVPCCAALVHLSHVTTPAV